MLEIITATTTTTTTTTTSSSDSDSEYSKKVRYINTSSSSSCSRIPLVLHEALSVLPSHVNHPWKATLPLPPLTATTPFPSSPPPPSTTTTPPPLSPRLSRANLHRANSNSGREISSSRSSSVRRGG